MIQVNHNNYLAALLSSKDRINGHQVEITLISSPE